MSGSRRTPLRILMTGAGAPGGWGIIKALRAGADRPVEIVGADMRPDAVGFALCDHAEVIPAAGSEQFIPHMIDLCQTLQIDVLVPIVTRELLPFATNRDRFATQGTRVVVAPPDVLELVNDKGRAVESLRSVGIPAPESRIVHSGNALRDAAHELGYPGMPVVVKPCVSNGSRGVRVLDPAADRLRMLLDEKPSSLVSTLDDVAEALDGAEPFPPYVVMEYLPGVEFSVDTLTADGKALAVLPRRRDRIRSGITVEGTLVQDREIIELCERMTAHFRPFGPIGYQVRRDHAGQPKLIEVNPRLQGTTALSVGAGVNIPWLSVLLALSERVDVPEPRWGTRVLRYWGDAFIGPDGGFHGLDGSPLA